MRWAVVAVASALALSAAVWTAASVWLPAVWAEYVALLAAGMALSLAGAWASARRERPGRSQPEPVAPSSPEERATA